MRNGGHPSDAGNALAVWDNQGHVWVARFSAVTGNWSPEKMLANYVAADAEVAFARGCPIALVLWWGQDTTGTRGTFSLAFH